jgi:hypothetical protein
MAKRRPTKAWSSRRNKRSRNRPTTLHPETNLKGISQTQKVNETPSANRRGKRMHSRKGSCGDMPNPNKTGEILTSQVPTCQSTHSNCRLKIFPGNKCTNPKLLERLKILKARAKFLRERGICQFRLPKFLLTKLFTGKDEMRDAILASINQEKIFFWNPIRGSFTMSVGCNSSTRILREILYSASDVSMRQLLALRKNIRSFRPPAI